MQCYQLVIPAELRIMYPRGLQSTVVSILASPPAAPAPIHSVPELFFKLMLPRFIDSALLREWTVDSWLNPSSTSWWQAASTTKVWCILGCFFKVKNRHSPTSFIFLRSTGKDNRRLLKRCPIPVAKNNLSLMGFVSDFLFIGTWCFADRLKSC